MNENEKNKEERKEKMLIDDRGEMEIEMKVMSDRKKREGMKKRKKKVNVKKNRGTHDV